MGKEHVARADERRRVPTVYAEFREVGAKKWGFLKAGVRRGLVVNLSRGGMGMRLTEPLKPQTLLDVKLELPGARTEVRVKAKVQWQKEESKLGTVHYTHIIGAQFTEYSPESWRIIQDFLTQ